MQVEAMKKSAAKSFYERLANFHRAATKKRLKEAFRRKPRPARVIPPKDTA